MVTNISYNVIIDRLKAFATGHFLIKHFSHGQIDLRYLEKDADYYPWMHVIPGTINPAEGLREYSFDITFSDLTRDKEHESEYIREAISDCTRLAEDLLAEIKNGNTLFDSSVQIVDGSSITPFIHEDTHTLTGVTLSLSIRVPWDWSACDIPADYAPGGSGSGGGAFGGCCVTLQVGGVDNIDQTLLNLIEGTNMTITDNGDGSVTFDSTGGIASISWGEILGTLSDQTDLQNALDLKADISSLATVATTGDYNDLLNLPSLSGFVPYTGATNDVAIGNHNITADDGSFNSAMQPNLFGVENAAATEYATLEYNALSVVNSNTGDTTQITSTGITFPDATTQSTAAVPQVNSDWNAVSGVSEILNKPTIPAAQVNSDWNAVGGVAQILNKPTSLPPSGNAGGDLQGTYPNPTVHRIHGVDMQSATPSTDDVWVYGGSPAKWRHQQLQASQVDNDSAVTGTNVDDALDHLNTTKVETTRSISTTSPLSGGGDLSANRTLSIAQANSTTDGYLSSADWVTFNSKVGASNLPYFGDGSTSGTTTISGTIQLSADTYYQNLTIASGGVLHLRGWRVFVSGTLDLTNAGANAIHNNGYAGNNSGGFGGAANGSATTGKLGVGRTVAGGEDTTSNAADSAGKGGNGGNGGSAGNGNGVAGTSSTTPTANLYRIAGTAGAGGKGGNAGGTGANGGAGQTNVANNASGYIALIRNIGVYGILKYEELANNTFLGSPTTQTVFPGLNGGGGGGGAGAAGGGGGGGAGGGGGGFTFVYAKTILISASTNAAAIAAIGGAGGNGGSSGNANTGGGAGAGGGGGGYVYVLCNSITGGNYTFISAAGGAGGNGANGLGTGFGGQGGSGGSGGRITVIRIADGTITQVNGLTNAGTTPAIPTTATATTGGAGGTCNYTA